jgi:hypothetical protein
LGAFVFALTTVDGNLRRKDITISLSEPSYAKYRTALVRSNCLLVQAPFTFNRSNGDAKTQQLSTFTQFKRTPGPLAASNGFCDLSPSDARQVDASFKPRYGVGTTGHGVRRSRLGHKQLSVLNGIFVNPLGSCVCLLGVAGLGDTSAHSSKTHEARFDARRK